MKDISYLFGAGASCESMPLVNNFKERYECFLKFIKNRIIFINNLAGDCLIFSEELAGHSTFDTYFKKLFHQNKEAEIKKYKSILFFYFLFEHLFATDPLNHKEERIIKDYKLDPRYEALIAGLLKPIKGEVEFYKNINFLTWNYDANLLNALRNFISPDKPLNDFIIENFKDGYFHISDQVKVFHLNGFITHPILNEMQNNHEIIFSSFIDLLGKYGLPELEQYVDNIKFAWESDSNSLVDASLALQSTQKLICIGYSFPLYNRIFDTQLINMNTMVGRHLYIQNKDTEPLKNILSSDFQIPIKPESKSDPEVTFSENYTSFLVPNDIFS